MKVKNVKMIEQHLEKAVLAVAVAAAAYLAYSAFSSPVTADHNGSPVKASDVAREINTSVGSLRNDLAKNAEQQQTVTIEDFVGKYKAIANQPLPVELQHGVASFTPLNMGPPAGVGPSAVDSRQVVILTPEVPAPTALTAEVSRGRITTEPPPAPGATPPPTPDLKDTKDKDVEWVMLKATYPMSKLLQAMTAPQNRIPAEAQRYTFARVEVERQAQNPDGTWPTQWQTVPPVGSVELPPIQLAANADAEAVKKVLEELDNGWAAVLRPAFYRTVTPPLLQHAPPPAPPPVVRRVIPPPQLQNIDTPVATGGDLTVDAPPPVAPPPQIIRRPVPTPAKPTPVVAPTPAPAAPPVDAPPAAENLPPEQGHQAIMQETNVPIWFYDEHVKGGARYRYRMRVAIFNPLFHLDMQLKDPNAKNRPWLRSDWAVLAEPVTIDPSSQMFVVRGGLARPNAASFHLYRWQYGHWFHTEESFVAGDTVGKTVKPFNFSEPIEYDTGYTVVAVDNLKSGETRVVLQGPNGELVTRDSLVDQSDPILVRLNQQITKDAAAAAAAAAAEASQSAPGT